MTNNVTTPLRRNGLLADLNFNLPYVSRSTQNKALAADCVILIAAAGGKRKTNRYHIDLSGWFRRVNEKVISPDDMNSPKTVAIGNDKAGNLFIVFNDKSIPESAPVNLQADNRQLFTTSKAMVVKAFMVAKQPTPTGSGDTTKLMFDMRMVQGYSNIYALEPKQRIDEKTGQGSKVTKF